MSEKLECPFVPVFVVSTPSGLEEGLRVMRMMDHRDTGFITVFNHEPDPLPIPDIYDDMNFANNPLFHTPPAIHRSAFPERRVTISTAQIAMATVALMSGRDRWLTKPVYRSSGPLKERVKVLEKLLQKHPNRNDAKLEILELRKQIKEIDATLMKGNKKGKQRK